MAGNSCRDARQVADEVGTFTVYRRWDEPQARGLDTKNPISSSM